MAQDPDRPSSLLPALALVAIVAVMLIGWWAFPRFQAWMASNDCVATGRVNC